MAKPKGWVKEPVRHGLAAKGIKTVTVRGLTYRDDSGVMMAPLRKVLKADAALPKKTRRFNGKTYQLWSIHSRKVDAQATAAAQPIYHARVVPTHGKWAVYRRKKREHGR